MLNSSRCVELGLNVFVIPDSIQARRKFFLNDIEIKKLQRKVKKKVKKIIILAGLSKGKVERPKYKQHT